MFLFQCQQSGNDYLEQHSEAKIEKKIEPPGLGHVVWQFTSCSTGTSFSYFAANVSSSGLAHIELPFVTCHQWKRLLGVHSHLSPVCFSLGPLWPSPQPPPYISILSAKCVKMIIMLELYSNLFAGPRLVFQWPWNWKTQKWRFVVSVPKAKQGLCEPCWAGLQPTWERSQSNL